MRNNDRVQWGASRWIILPSLALMAMIGVSGAEAAGLTYEVQRAQLPPELKDARIGDDPDIIPQGRGIADDSSPLRASAHTWNPMVVCTVREIGDDPDPVPRIWWMSCSGIGNDPDPIPPTN